jgi:DNA-binding CsgD family transcriptional regulator
MNALARARLHLRVADALHDRRASGAPMTAGEVAGHYLEARSLAPSDRTLTYAREAADEAMALGAPDQAARFLRLAIGMLVEEVADPDEIARLRAALIEAHGRSGDTDSAEQEAAPALAHWRAAGDRRAQAEIHALLAEHLNPRLQPADVIANADAGLALLGEERAPLAARLRSLRAHARHMVDDSSDLLPTADWLDAGGFNPPEPAAPVWSRLLRVLWHVWHEPDATATIALCREVVEHARRAGDRRAEALGRLWEAEVLGRDARTREALKALDEARRLAHETGSAPMLVDAGSLRAGILLHLGAWQELEQVVDDTLPVLIRLRSTYFGYTLIAAHAWSRRLRGLPWTMPNGLEIRFPDSQMFTAAYRTNTARLTWEAGLADERTTRLLDWLVGTVPRAGAGVAWATAGVPLLGTLALAGRRDDVTARYEGARAFPRFLQYASFGPLELARAATLLRRWDEAEAHFDAAVQIATAEELQVPLARTLVERGLMYRQRGRRGDRPRAAAVLERAAALCAELGLGPDEARARAALDRLGAIAPPALPAGLTPREGEVLKLLAAGRTNRQIADELTISEKTVEQHLLNLYQKLHVDSRAKAVAFAFANGLTG